MRAVRRTASILFMEIVIGLNLPSAGAVSLAGDAVTAAVRRTSDPAGTNYFAPPSGFVDGSTALTEFTAIDGDYQVTANFVSDYVNLAVDRIPTELNDFAPNYRFRFANLDFVPASVISGVTRFDGTPGVGISDVVFGPSEVEFTLGSTFLANGGSFGVSVRFDIIEIPEPAALSLILAGMAGVRSVGLIRRPSV